MKLKGQRRGKYKISNFPVMYEKSSPLISDEEFIADLKQKYYKGDKAARNTLYYELRNKGNCSAINYLLEAIKDGETFFYGELALHYYFGDMRIQDYEEAFRLFKLSLEYDPGDYHSAYYLGVCYSTGCGCKKNFDEAIKYWKIALDLGEEEAAYDLLFLYAFGGVGYDQNIEEAKIWLRKCLQCQNPEIVNYAKVIKEYIDDGSISEMNMNINITHKNDKKHE